MKRLASLAIWIPLLLAQDDRSGVRTVTAVRHWTQGDVTRVAVEVSADFKFHTDRLHNPERVYFDILDSHPRIGQKVFYTESLDDLRVKRLRVAETTPGVTRIVLDLAGPSDINTTKLANPDRLMIEVRVGAPTAIPTAAPPTDSAPAPIQSSVQSSVQAPIQAPIQAKLEPPHPDPPAPSEAPKPDPIVPSRQVKSLVAAPDLASAEMVVAEPAKNQLAAKPEDVTKPPEPVAPAPAPIEAPKTTRHDPPPSTTPPATPSNILAETGKAARRNASGDSSLIRELGLKISRVVIDPGHGGHDQGTTGGKGLLEKELVLDVGKRVGKLIEDKMGAEVVYTRSDDTFIPLERRTAIANEKKADLFLSIHANSSPYPKITGIETYYLNFADTKDAMDVAARENANAHESIFELRDMVQKITLHDKAEESKDFASRIQTALFALTAREIPGSRNRGVKKAPFVVLIGAQMPSILTEIGFLSNPREEALLKRPDYRQKLAEAIFHGVQKYADSLSHFQVAQTQNQP